MSILLTNQAARKLEQLQSALNFPNCYLLQLLETQLSLTNRATRLEVSQGHQTYGTILYVTYGFLLLCYSNFVRKTHFLEIRLQKML